MQALILGVVLVLAASFLLTVISASLERERCEKCSLSKAFFEEFFSDLKILFHAVFHRPKDPITLLKHVQQIGLYLLEVFSVCGVFVIAAESIKPVEAGGLLFWYEQIMRFLSFYTAYQIFVFSILNLTHSAKEDSWIEVERLIYLVQLYLTTGDKAAREKLKIEFEDVLDPYTFMDKDALQMAQELFEITKLADADRMQTERDYRTQLDLAEIEASHQAEASGLFWQFSLLLNAIK